MSMSTSDFARAKKMVANRQVPEGIADDVASFLPLRIAELKADLATLDVNAADAPNWTASARLDFVRRIELLELLIEALVEE